MSPASSTLLELAALLWQLLVATWPFILLLLVVKRVALLPDILKRRHLAAAGIQQIDKMDGAAFEECLAALFSRQGYQVEQTPYRGDWGADLVLSKNGTRTVVQAKRYKNSVGVRAVQEAVAAKAKYKCTEAMVVTNSTFTRQAIELARANRVTLVDREQLIRQLLRHKSSPKRVA